MTISTLEPVNVTNGGAVNPFQGNTWAPSQVKYLAVYNTGPVAVQVTTQNGTKVIQPQNADYVPTNGNAVSIQLAATFSSESVIFTVCNLVVYDDAESEPFGFPYTLPAPEPNTATLVAYKVRSSLAGFLVAVPKGTIGLILQAPPGTDCSVIGFTSGSFFLNNVTIPSSGFLEVNVLPGKDTVYKVGAVNQPLSVYATTQQYGTPYPPELTDTSGYVGLKAFPGWEVAPSPRGRAFGQALRASANSGTLETLPGNNGYQGAVTGPFSAEIIYTPSAENSGNFPGGIIFGRSNEWSIQWDSGTRQIVGYVYDGSGSAHGIVSTASLQPGIPYHLALSWDGTDAWLYINGNLQGSTAVANLASPSDQTALGIGTSGATPTGDVFDEARVGGLRYSTVNSFEIPQAPLEDDDATLVLFHFDNGDIPQATTTQTITVVSPPAGANWSYTLPRAGRLLSIGCTYFCSATVANRQPYVSFSLGNGNAYDFLPSGTSLTASQASNLSMRAGPGFVPYHSDAANAWMSSMTDYGVLPAGTVINSGVGNGGIQASDQWSNINLQLEPV